MKTFEVPAGMPLSVFRDKYARKKDGGYESWADVADRMVDGNLALRANYPLPMQYQDASNPRVEDVEFRNLARAGVIPLSGRHLQHGDLSQPTRIGDLFANCSTAMFSWASFLMLMKGAGIGRDFSSAMCWVNWDCLPECRFVLDGPDKTGKGGHADYEPWIERLDEARAKYDADSEGVRWFEVEDSAEGWAKVVMILETACFHKNNRNTIFVFDFSKVRKKGAPLKGQQDRPASGPVPFIRALHQVMSIRGAGMKPWKQAIHVDHYLAACVVVGGVRRSARAATKYWRDRDVIEFIDVKRGGFLWSANNSIAVDAEFWKQAADPRPTHARRVFEAAIQASYYDDTGEPGFFNYDRFNVFLDDLDDVQASTYISAEYRHRFGDIHPRTFEMIDYVLFKAKHHAYQFIPNPCFEIPLAIYGANCYVGDVCPANAETRDEVLGGVRRAAEALVRVNTMPCLYQAEVRRTNRIGTSLTGIHEFMWRQFGLGFRESVGSLGNGKFLEWEEMTLRSREFWKFLELCRDAAEHASAQEARRCGLPAPATVTTIKPAGTVGKVMATTEGAHLPATHHYVRWVMRVKGSEEVQKFIDAGYQIKDVSHQYANTVVVGFPTCLSIIEEQPGLVIASEATPAEQYRWLMLLERFWLGDNRRNGQVSYTLKWRKSETNYEAYMRMVLENQPKVRVCSLMPEIEDQGASAYAYVPEEPISPERYRELVAAIKQPVLEEAYDSAQLACEGGACPIEENIREVVS